MISIRDASADKGKQLESLKSQNQKLQSLKSKWDSMGDEKNLVDTAFPDEENVDSYISEITSKASRSGILLTDIKLDSANAAETDANPDYICGNDSNGDPSQVAISQAATDGTMQTPGASGSGSGASASNCLQTVEISLSASGSWEQLLDFFKYLEDMNRISNIQSVSLSAASQIQSETPSNILSAEVSANAFFKGKNQNGNMTLANNLASQGNFNQNAIEKLKNAIYASYDVPAVAPAGERNMFQ